MLKITTQERILTGRTEEHLRPCWNGALVHQGILLPLERLKARAEKAGFDLAIASGFRSFERQMSICQQKLSGHRPLLSTAGERLQVADLTEDEQLSALLRWSALPGTSRHHWGTDLDLFDASAISKEYQLQLTPDEYYEGGPFAKFHQWLVADMAESGRDDGLFFPYGQDRGAVAPEPWHVSFGCVASELQQGFDFSVFERLLNETDWPLKASIEKRAVDIFQRYVQLL